MSEFAAYHEAPPLNPAEQHLLDLLTMPPHVEEAQRQAFEAELEALIARQPTDERREFVRTGAELRRWIHFGKPGEPLPAAYSVTYSTVNGSTDITYNAGAAPIPPKIQDYVAENLKTIAEYQLQCQLPPLRGAIVDAIADVIRTQPQYQYLSSFLVAQTDQTERPLSPPAYAIRAAQVTEQTMQRFGVEPERFAYDINASQHYKHGLGRLESATEPHKSAASTQSAFEYFNGWLLANLCTHIGPYANDHRLTAPSGNLTSIQLAPSAHTGLLRLVACTDRGEQFPLAANLLQDIIREAVPEKDRLPYELPELARDLGYAFVYNLYAQDNKNLQSVLEVTVQQQAEQSGYHNVLDKWGPDPAVAACLRRPRSPLYERTYSTQSNYRSDTIYDAQFSFNVLSKDIAELSKKDSIGVITYRSPRVTDGRMVITQTAQAEYPTTASFYDLEIALDSDKSLGRPDSGTAPAVPGMEVVARDGNIWRFAMANHDPYRGSERISIDAKRAAILAQHYESLGLHGLVRDMRHHKGALHVTDLVRYIVQSTDYTYDSSLPWEMGASAPWPLHTFAPYISNGHLHAQCTGSGMFLAASLDIALPGCNPKPLGGHKLPQEGGKVSALGHQQTIILYNNKPYIVDATGREVEVAASPSSAQAEQHAVSSLIALGAFAVKSTLYQIGRNLRPHKPYVTPENTSPRVTPEYLRAQHKTHLDQTIRHTEQLLQAMLKAENQDALYKHLGTLNKHDPNNMTIAALASAQQGNWQALDDARSFIAGYTQLDETERITMRKQYGMPVYTDRHMTLLVDQLTAAQRVAPQRARS